jgi:hypothetical protein
MLLLSATTLVMMAMTMPLNLGAVLLRVNA